MRKALAIFLIALFCGAMSWIFYTRTHQEPAAPSPEAQLDDTLLLDHSRIPDNVRQGIPPDAHDPIRIPVDTEK